jgi:lysophospholipase L1-like esterase
LRSAFRFYLDAYGRDVDVDRLHANRLAQTQLMQRFCAKAGIPFLDVTTALMARLAEGENVYFPDESHLNEVGEGILADTLAAYLRP